jgi:hypothetical protein
MGFQGGGFEGLGKFGHGRDLGWRSVEHGACRQGQGNRRF